MPLTKPVDWQIRNSRVLLSTLLIAGWLTACGGGGGGGGGGTVTPPAQTYSIGGAVTGLTASGLVLQNNGGDNLTVAANATTFTFPTKVAANGAYAVTVMTQPTNESCTVTGGSGTVASSAVTTVSVACTSTVTPTFTVGGTITGYTGAGLVLQNSGGNNYTIPTKATTFTFPTKVATGAAYAVTVLTQPTSPPQTCTVTSGTGTMGSANVTTVHIACVNMGFTIGGSIKSLTGAGLILQDNGGDNLPVAANATSFTFKTPVLAGAVYAVTVLTQPTNQTCTVTSGSGTVVASNVTNVAIQCVTSYTIGGTISGLTGTTGVVLQDNGGDNLTVAAKATTFTFKTGLKTGVAYAVTVLTQPSHPNQYCTVTNGTGTVATANISNVAVSCINIGRFAFVANLSDGTNGDVSAFTIDPTTGLLTPVMGSPFVADQGPTAVAVDTNGLYAYVSNVTTSDLTIFSVDQTAGTLTPVANVVTPGTGGASIAVSPSDQYVYVAGYGANPAPNTGSIAGFTNSGSGSLTALSSGPFQAGDTPYGVAVDPASQLVFATTANSHFLWVYTIGSDGSLTAVNQYSTGSGSYGVAVYPLGTASGGFVYTANGASNTVSGFSYDGSGNLTALSGSPFYPKNTTPQGIAIDPQGQYLYVTNRGDNNVTTFSIDPSTGNLTLMGTVLTGQGPIAVTVDPSGQFVYVVNYTDGSVSLFSASAGVLSLVHTYATGGGASSIAIE